ncbi:hypothetical protein NDJ14_16985 [Vibrio alginolyticus]|uniref:hypothetical protein n=1 Tax=Vibrio TaxID=662 RepID=UPI00215E6EE0|nr:MULTISPECIES: hypothetical protein [Vibrio]ELE6591611.1 hypothetical protein [Vibrio alginolyticus]MCS0131104.1 hypothetical protein [Vibrio alginolyticus]MCS0158626.1 hypothetical protein [Vibrio alginolyticus]MDW1769975.1 hypothetical protein [Vibrio sp. Vb2532]
MSNRRNINTAQGDQTPITMVAKEIDGESFRIECDYYYNGEKCKTKEMTSKQAKIVAAYGLVKKDLKFVEKVINHAVKISAVILEQDLSHLESDDHVAVIRKEVDIDSDLYKSLYISAVVTYGKCFVQAKGRKVKLEIADIFSDNDKMKTLHLDIMESRHQYIAHAGVTKFEHSKPVLIFTPYNEPYFNAESGHVSGLGTDELAEFLNLVKFVHAKVNDIFQKKSDKLYETEVEGVPIEDLMIGAK